jgi:hypothetical protein
MIGVPYVIGESLVDGGKPESVEAKELSVLKESRLYFVNFHYQGSNKYLIQYDVCRILLHTGNFISFYFIILILILILILFNLRFLCSIFNMRPYNMS